MKTFFFWLSLLFVVGSGFRVAAMQAPASSSQMEASMVLTGEVEVDARGMVTQYTLDGHEKLTPALREFVDQNVKLWRFEPVLVDGEPATVRNRMGLQLVLGPQRDGNFKIELRESAFYPSNKESTEELVRAEMKAPMYPGAAGKAGIEADVYLVLRVGRDGRVKDVAVEQVNLKSRGVGYEAARWRRLFASSATAAARGWTFRAPTEGVEAGDELWNVRVPVNYQFEEREYGVWTTYLPGPRQEVPWLAGQELGSPEALATGGLYQMNTKEATLRLIAPRDVDG